MTLTYALLIAVALITIIFYSIRKYRENLEQQKQYLQLKGFSSLEYLDESMIDDICEMRNIKRDKIRIKNIYQYSRFHYRMYRFELDEVGSDSSASLVYALVNRSFDLPRISIFPKINIGGVLGTMINQMVKFLGTRKGLQEITVGNHRFDEKYTMMSSDDTYSIKRIDPMYWEHFAMIPQYLAIDAKDDTVLFNVMLSEDRKRNRKLHSDIKIQLDTYMNVADQLNGILASPHRQAELVR